MSVSDDRLAEQLRLLPKDRDAALVALGDEGTEAQT